LAGIFEITEDQVESAIVCVLSMTMYGSFAFGAFDISVIAIRIGDIRQLQRKPSFTQNGWGWQIERGDIERARSWLPGIDVA
jgi:hypothetical protein